MYCEKCGNPIAEGSKFCMNCGARAETDASSGQAVQEAAASAEAPVLEREPAAEAKVSGDKPTEEDMSAAENGPAAEEKAAVEPQSAPIRPSTVQPSPQPAAVQPAPQPAPYQRPQSAPTQTAPSQANQQPIQQMQPPAAQKPEKVSPLPVWKFMGIFILIAIPVVSLIMTLVWSFGSSCNRNTKNFARALLIFKILGLIYLIVNIVLYWEFIQYIWENFSNFNPIGMDIGF